MSERDAHTQGRQAAQPTLGTEPRKFAASPTRPGRAAANSQPGDVPRHGPAGGHHRGACGGRERHGRGTGPHNVGVEQVTRLQQTTTADSMPPPGHTKHRNTHDPPATCSRSRPPSLPRPTTPTTAPPRAQAAHRHRGHGRTARSSPSIIVENAPQGRPSSRSSSATPGGCSHGVLLLNDSQTPARGVGVQLGGPTGPLGYRNSPRR
jgi:hypothetical protein